MTDDEVLAEIGDEEAVSVTQMCARLESSDRRPSRLAMRKHLKRLEQAGALVSSCRKRRLWHRPRTGRALQ